MFSLVGTIAGLFGAMFTSAFIAVVTALATIAFVRLLDVSMDKIGSDDATVPVAVPSSVARADAPADSFAE